MPSRTLWISIRTNWIQPSTLKNAGGKERRAELRRSARRQQFIITVSSWRFYNRQEEVLDQKSPKVIDRFVFNYLAVDNAGQTADNKHNFSLRADEIKLWLTQSLVIVCAQAIKICIRIKSNFSWIKFVGTLSWLGKRKNIRRLVFTFCMK